MPLPPLTFVIMEYFFPMLILVPVIPIRLILRGETVAVGAVVGTVVGLTSGVVVATGAFVVGRVEAVGVAVAFGVVLASGVAVN